jgi:hypothetical protein
MIFLEFTLFLLVISGAVQIPAVQEGAATLSIPNRQAVNFLLSRPDRSDQNQITLPGNSRQNLLLRTVCVAQPALLKLESIAKS